MSFNKSVLKWVSENAEVLLSSLGIRWIHMQREVKRNLWIGQAFEEENLCQNTSERATTMDSTKIYSHEVS